MATRKKAKGKAKTKRKKAPKTKAVQKKPPKKTQVRRTSPKKGRASPKKGRASPKNERPIAKAKMAPASPSAQPAQPALLEERIGVVTHYYGHVSVATLRLELGTLRVGDMIHFRGHTTDFSQCVGSLEIDHAPATEVGPNDDFGLKVDGHVREHDVVYKVRR
jgi:hypothetical protein